MLEVTHTHTVHTPYICARSVWDRLSKHNTLTHPHTGKDDVMSCPFLPCRHHKQTSHKLCGNSPLGNVLSTPCDAHCVLALCVWIVLVGVDAVHSLLQFHLLIQAFYKKEITSVISGNSEFPAI